MDRPRNELNQQCKTRSNNNSITIPGPTPPDVKFTFAIGKGTFWVNRLSDIVWEFAQETENRIRFDQRRVCTFVYQVLARLSDLLAHMFLRNRVQSSKLF